MANKRVVSHKMLWDLSLLKSLSTHGILFDLNVCKLSVQCIGNVLVKTFKPGCDIFDGGFTQVFCSPLIKVQAYRVCLKCEVGSLLILWLAITVTLTDAKPIAHFPPYPRVLISKQKKMFYLSIFNVRPAHSLWSFPQNT